METLTISAKYIKGKLIPLESLPKDLDYDALIILMRHENKTEQKNLLKIKPLSMGKIKTNLSREEIYNEGK